MKLSLILLFVVLLTACGAQEPYSYGFSGSVMGTSYNVTLIAERPLDEDSRRKVKDLVGERLQMVDRLMSTYKSESEISQFNRLSVGDSVLVSDETADVIAMARKVNDQSNGAFDISVASLVSLWGFGPKDMPLEPPPAEQIKLVASEIGNQSYSLSDNRLTKQGNVHLDLSAIAKGYGVDLAAHALSELGYERYLVEVGGEIAAKGRNSRNTPWVLGVEQPDIPGRKAYTRVYLSGESLATSGDYRNYYELDGLRISHTIDPRSGQPVDHALASVSVIHHRTALADAWATALMVLGQEEGFKLAQSQGLAAYFIVREGNGFASKHTEGFNTYLSAER